jgi:hypothetical protein
VIGWPGVITPSRLGNCIIEQVINIGALKIKLKLKSYANIPFLCRASENEEAVFHEEEVFRVEGACYNE